MADKNLKYCKIQLMESDVIRSVIKHLDNHIGTKDVITMLEQNFAKTEFASEFAKYLQNIISC